MIHGVAARMTARQARALARLRIVHAVSINTPIKTQSLSFTPSKLATWFNHDAATENLWGQYTGAGIGVAVIDSGVQGNLPDFRLSQSNSSSRVIDSAVVNPYATSANDPYGHGTMVAGAVGGDGGVRPSGDPLFGQYAGAAPNANIVSIKVGDEQGNATVLDVLYGIQFAIDHKAADNIRVLNLSLQSNSAQSYTTDPLDAAVEAAWFDGIVVVAAAGNRGGTSNPASYAPANDPYVITVGAVGDAQTIQHMVQVLQAQDHAKEQAITDPVQRQAQAAGDAQQEHALQASAGLPAPWSSGGVTQDGVVKPDIYAPGRYIVSDLAPRSTLAAECPSCVISGQYIMASGTSLAAPIVSGAVADILQAHPNWTPNMVKGALIHTGTAPPGYAGGSTGVINANAANSASTAMLTSNAGLTPSSLVVTPTGGSPSWSGWSRSSWSAAQAALSAPWARSSWSCTCSRTASGAVDPTRSSWSTSAWTLFFEPL